MALRVALGASLRGLAQHLTESVLLSTIGGIAGLLFAVTAMKTGEPVISNHSAFR